MEILLRDILSQGLDLDFEADPSNLDLLEEGIGFEGLVHVHLSVSKQREMVFVTGRAQTQLLLECGRCLKKFPCPLNLGIQAEYLSSKSLPTQEEQELKPEEMDVIFYSGDTIQFDDLIREQIILAIPMHPLCTPGCLGLCPRCGQDRNKGDCQCKASDLDPRFSILKNYFKKK
ncbi:MAG: DUF177 domain-containing protein [Nitrospira sp.]|nr:DUF177 domain-containing protein [Nitrospira sp.]